MSRLKRISSVLLIAVGTVQAADETVHSVHVNPSVEHGVWEGWGNSLAWWGKVYGDRENLADLFFTTDSVEVDWHPEPLPGLGMNIVRYNAGASSWEKIGDREMVVSNTILPFRQIEGYWLDGLDPDPASDSWDWSVDANQRAMLLMARDRGATHFELFSNSPMWWMTKNDNPSGAAEATHDNVSPHHYHNFAYYLATIARHAADNWDVKFTTVSPFNEPTSKWWHEHCKQEGAHVSVSEQLKILPLVRAAFDAQGLGEVDLVASDESFVDQAVAAWEAYTPEVKAIIDQVNVHGYQGAGGDRGRLYQITRVEDGKTLWNSEYGDGKANGLDLARNFHRDMARMHPTAWAYWQPIDGGKAGTGGSGWGLIDAKMLEATGLRANPKFFVFAQYSRHIRPGMAILDVNDAHTVVAYDAESEKLVIAGLNDSDEPRTIEYDLSAFKRVGALGASWITEPEGEARYATGSGTTLEGTKLIAHFPPHAIQTFELTGVTR